MELVTIMAVCLLVLAVAGLAAVMAVRSLVQLCQPNEAMVVAGTVRQLGGRTLGYRVVQGGRVIRIPLLEKVFRLDLTNMVIELRVRGAYSKGGIPLNVDGVANVKIASDVTVMANAIERFLGKPREQMIQLAKDTLEGTLRGVLATLTPEELNQDRVKFALGLQQEAETDLRRLGLVLDTMKIQNVSDDRGYLDSIGRRQSADLQMRSRVAEAENQALSALRRAKNLEDKELTRIAAETELAKAEVDRRIVEARARKAALIAEAQADVAAALARAEAELAVQTARTEKVKVELEASQVRPAEAARDALVAQARAQAAPVVENGRATARALLALAAEVSQPGVDVGRLLVAQHLPKLVEAVLGKPHVSGAGRLAVVAPEVLNRPGLGAGALDAGMGALLLGAANLGKLPEAPGNR